MRTPRFALKNVVQRTLVLISSFVGKTVNSVGQQSSGTNISTQVYLASVGAIAGLWLPSLGWVFVGQYFEIWGIPFSDNAFEFKEYIYFGIDVYTRSGYLLTAVFIAFCVFCFLANFRNSWLLRVLFGALAVAALLGLVFFSHQQAKKMALLEYEELRNIDYVGLPRAFVSVDNEREIGDSFFLDELSQKGCYRIILFGNDFLWIARGYSNIDGSPVRKSAQIAGVPISSITNIRYHAINHMNCK